MNDKGASQVTAYYFDVPHWCAKIREVYNEVFDAYPTGCLEWLRNSDPSRVAKLKATVEEAKRAYLAQDVSAFESALADYLDSHLRVFDEYHRKRDKKRRTF
jgi:hypothetical protein